jgi:hypothetical protein
VQGCRSLIARYDCCWNSRVAQQVHIKISTVLCTTTLPDYQVAFHAVQLQYKAGSSPAGRPMWAVIRKSLCASKHADSLSIKQQRDKQRALSLYSLCAAVYLEASHASCVVFLTGAGSPPLDGCNTLASRAVHCRHARQLVVVLSIPTGNRLDGRQG